MYGRTGPMGTSEQAFYIPHLRTQLPGGSQQLQKEEEKDKNYDQMRRSEQEIMMDFDTFNDSDESKSFEKEMANFKSTADRRMLQTVYDLSPDQSREVGEIAESIKEETIEEMIQLNGNGKDAQVVDRFDNQKVDENENDQAKKDVKIRVDQTKTADIIGSIAKPALKNEESQLLKKKKKVKPENNPILKNWKQRSTMAAEEKEYSPKKILAPYPSYEHFAGIWRLVTSPGGPMIDEEALLQTLKGDPNSSENLILRIDGTTAGGPILDVENQHRAAGGTWKFFQAEFCGTDDGGDSDADTDTDRPVQTRLRVRLLIPPTKNTVLVMEGEVKRGSITSAEDISRENAKELFSSSSFGLNNVNPVIDSKASTKNENDDEFMYVTGEAWVEEKSGAERRRKKLGRFSLMKATTDRNQGQYKYSIPAPTRYQD